MEQFFGDVVQQDWEDVHDQAIDEFFESYRFKRCKQADQVTEADVVAAIDNITRPAQRPKPAMTLDTAEANLDASDSDASTVSEWQRVNELPPRRLNFDSL